MPAFLLRTRMFRSLCYILQPSLPVLPVTKRQIVENSLFTVIHIIPVYFILPEIANSKHSKHCKKFGNTAYSCPQTESHTQNSRQYCRACFYPSLAHSAMLILYWVFHTLGSSKWGPEVHQFHRISPGYHFFHILSQKSVVVQ